MPRPVPFVSVALRAQEPFQERELVPAELVESLDLGSSRSLGQHEAHRDRGRVGRVQVMHRGEGQNAECLEVDAHYVAVPVDELAPQAKPFRRKLRESFSNGEFYDYVWVNDCEKACKWDGTAADGSSSY